MIVFDYQCPKCQYIRAEYRESSEDTSFAVNPCIACNQPMHKILSATVGIVPGTETPTYISRKR